MAQDALLILDMEVSVGRAHERQTAALGHRAGGEDTLERLHGAGEALVVLRRQLAAVARLLLPPEEGAREAVAEVAEVGVADGDWVSQWMFGDSMV